ncbi:MAG: hypothetical protein Rubg2KO_30680 [Rubricoccaceae bacterium]
MLSRTPGADLQALDDALDPDATLRSLLLALMSRLLTTRGIAVRADGATGRVEHVRGPLELAEGDVIELAEGAETPARLREAGIAVWLPLAHGDTSVAWIGLGAKATGAAYDPTEIAFAQSLANASAASIHAAEMARDLAQTGRRLAERAQELRTLFELSQAFGQALGRDAILGRLGFALMGQLLVTRCCIALRQPSGRRSQPEGSLEAVWTRGATAPEVPNELADLASPGEANLDGWRWAIPIRAGTVSRGVALLGDRADGSEVEADFAASLAALAVGALETADRVTERVERERTEQEMRLARQMQRGLLPAVTPEVAGLDIAARWEPSRSVSGDTYELCALTNADGQPDGRLLIAVADVVGKGIGAALLMATLQAGFHLLRDDLRQPSGRRSQPDADLGAATARLDRLISESTEPHQFVTLAWGIVDVPRQRFRYVVAGHLPPRLMRASGAIESLEVGGPLLGVVPGATFQTGEIELATGDLLVLYTDGITEAENEAAEEFDIPGLDAALQAGPRTNAGNALDALVDAVTRFADQDPTEADDLTLVAVRVKGQ